MKMQNDMLQKNGSRSSALKSSFPNQLDSVPLSLLTLRFQHGFVVGINKAEAACFVSNKIYG